MKAIAFLIFFAILFQCSNAQTVILRLKLSRPDSIVATIQLFKLPDSSLVFSGPIADSVDVNVSSNTIYSLRVSAAGKKVVVRRVTIKNASLSVHILLTDEVTQLKEVTVVSRKPFIKQEDDKTIVDAEVLGNSSTNAYEVLEKTPGAVLVDGNVYLNSATPATIQINGREVKMGADELSALLKNLPANSIVKIEILRTPSAKSDAASSGGIVNIVLKKDMKIGVNGSVNTEYSQGKYSNVGTGFNISHRAGKLKLDLSYQVNKRLNYEDLSTDRFFGDSVLSQRAYTTYPSVGHFLKLGADYEISKKLSVGYGGRITAGKNNNNAYNDISYNRAGNLLATSLALTANNNRQINVNNDVDVLLKLDSAGGQWTNELSYNYNRGNGAIEYENILISPANFQLVGNGVSLSTRHAVSWQSDLVKAVGKIKVESGFKLSNNNQNNDANFLLNKGGGFETDSAKSVLFDFSEKISSAYFQASYKLIGITVKPGLRYEHTNISGRQYTPYDTGFAIKRTDFFPYVFLSKKLFTLFKMEIVANGIFRKSISRPGYSALNPTPVYVDQFVYNIGNPNLKPQFTNTYEFNITAMGYPVFSIGKNAVKNVFNQVVYQDSSTKIIYNTYDNLGKNDELYIRGIAGIPPGKRYFFYVGAQHNLNRYKGFYQQRPFSLTNGSWLFFLFQEMKLSQKTKISSFGFYRLRSLFNFYQLKPFGMVNFSVNQSLLKQKANLVLSLNDAFRTMRIRFALLQPGINANGLRFNDSRRVTLKFIYNFGIKPRQEQRPGFEIPTDNG